MIALARHAICVAADLRHPPAPWPLVRLLETWTVPDVDAEMTDRIAALERALDRTERALDDCRVRRLVEIVVAFVLGGAAVLLAGILGVRI